MWAAYHAAGPSQRIHFLAKQLGASTGSHNAVTVTLATPLYIALTE